MQSRKWMLLPPAVALLLVLGPMSMSNAASSASARPPGPAAATPSPGNSAVDVAAPPTAGAQGGTQSGAPAESAAPARPPLPKPPDVWQVAATLIGLLLLGGAGLWLFGRMRRGGPTTAHGIALLRQTIRLSARHSLHAVEFDGRMLLVGEGERGVQLLHASAAPTPEADLAELAARVASEPADDGAVPRNLVIPRPAQRQPAPSPARTAAAPAAATSKPPRRPLGDFRTLLAKAGR